MSLEKLGHSMENICLVVLTSKSFLKRGEPIRKIQEK